MEGEYMWKKILLVQICVCLFIITGYITIEKSGVESLKDRRSEAIAAISKHYTTKDILDVGKDTVAELIDSPATLTGYILKGQEAQKYAEPIDPVIEGAITSVYAVSGGQVIETGENSELGRYIKIQHDGAVSVYGNCCRVYAKDGKHVRRGQVIGSYIQDENNTFYYELIEE